MCVFLFINKCFLNSYRLIDINMPFKSSQIIFKSSLKYHLYRYKKKQFIDVFPFIDIYIDIYIYHSYRCFSRQSLHHTNTDPATVATGADAGATHRVHRVRRAARCGRRGT